jgi:hypothetical protein
MTIWLLVLVFATDEGPQGHVFARYNDKAKCQVLAEQFNRDGGKVAACVAWFK